MTNSNKLADECFCDRMYPDSNPNASCGDCPTRDYAPQPAPAHVQVDKRDREADRQRFPDAQFNSWLDDGISDCGHTVWDAIGDVCDAWHGWNARQLYAHPPAPAAEGAGELPPLPQATCLGFRNPCGITQLPDMGIYGYTADQVRAYTRSAIAALRQPVTDAVREDVLIRQLRGRAAFLRNRGRVKSPALMEEAASRLESALASQQESRNG